MIRYAIPKINKKEASQNVDLKQIAFIIQELMLVPIRGLML